ncbi:MAG: 50S ribosomal protein L9, partial [Deltaproteobacteria bacterium]
QRRKKIELRKLRAKEDAEELKKKMSEVLIQLSQKAGEEGKLYGSVTSMDIAGELEKQGIVVDRRKIMLDKPIKAVGEYDVPVRIYPEVVGSIRVAVSAKEDAE